MSQRLVYSNDVAKTIESLLPSHDMVFVITDETVRSKVLPRLEFQDIPVIAIPSGDMNKNIESLAMVWKFLSDNGASRHSVVLNIGGGMVTDLGGFAASTFKRGIRFINIPTTLLAAVDAAVGGKNGINFNGLKNEIGTFNEAEAVVISSCFFDTLPATEIKSGYGEMIKHALLSDRQSLDEILGFDFQSVSGNNLLGLLKKSVEVKRRIVSDDPKEQGIRKALNFGHTAGHAFESLAMKRNAPIPHGYAVAWGLVTELVLSHFVYKFNSALLHRIGKFVEVHYGVFKFGCNDYDDLIKYARHDKKSVAGELNFTLLSDVGNVHIDNAISEPDLKDAFDITRDILHI